MFCTKCGKEIEINCKYCEYCGSLNELYEEEDENFFKGEIVYEETKEEYTPREFACEKEERLETGETEYEGSKSGVWASYLKFNCYLGWGLNIVLGLFLGYMIAEDEPQVAMATTMLGGVIGFLLGFMQIAVSMLFITTCENIAIITDNTSMLLKRMDEKNKSM